jgi:colicin import membrane protein
MVVNQVRMKKHGLNAIFSIALCGLFHCASAQDASLNSAFATDTRAANELAERERIAQERDRSTQAYADAKVGCYQKFQVNACLTQARNQHNAQQADLKRQEVGLTDQQRKRRGAEQLQRTEDKTLVQREQEVQRQQGKAQEGDSKRQQRQADRKPAQNAVPAPSKAPTARPTNGATSQARAQDKAAAQQQRAAKASQAKAASQAKLKEAAERRENAQKRLEKSGKKPASSLPMPAGS